jgi:hypothetical protein
MLIEHTRKLTPMLYAFFADYLFSWAATSAAKSRCSFSMPSPRLKREKYFSVIGVPAAVAAF